MRIYRILLVLYLGTLLMGIFSYGVDTLYSNDITRNSAPTMNVLMKSELNDHTPINITSDQDFISQGWPGNGTPANPYIIENLRIDTIELPINIQNTTAYFVIRNCEISGSQYFTASLSLYNVTNGVIEDSLIITNGINSRNVTNMTFRNLTFLENSFFSFMIFNSEVTIENCTVVGSVGTIMLSEVNNSCIKFNKIYCKYFGISIFLSTNCSLLYNTLPYSGIEIYDSEIETFTIEGNIVFNKDFGTFVGQSDLDIDADEYGQVLVYDCSNVRVSRGTFYDVSTCINIISSSSVTVESVSFYRTYNGIVLRSVSNATISNNTFKDSMNFANLYNSDYVTIVCNNLNNVSTGIFVYNSYCNIINNNVSDAMFCGFLLGSSHYSTITNNTFYNAAIGVQIVSSSSTKVTNNNISNSAQTGIVLYQTKTSVSDNIISNSKSGILLDGCLASTISRNTIFDSSIGIQLSSSNNSQIINNTIYNNNYGIRIDSNSGDNVLYGNRLTLNTEQNAVDNGIDNVWDDGTSIGNYWGDYDDSGEYEIPGTAGSVDRYPQGSDIDGDGLYDEKEVEMGFDPYEANIAFDVRIILIIGGIGISAFLLVILWRRRISQD